MTIGLRRVRLEFFSLSTTRVVNHSRFFADHRQSFGPVGCDRANFVESTGLRMGHCSEASGESG